MKIAVSGLGLIGGSFYNASLRAGYEVKGLHHNESDGLSEADLVIVAQPPAAIVPWVKANAANFKPGAIVFDICGTKRRIVRDLGEFLAIEKSRNRKIEKFSFVGGHPMAGREVSGYENSLATLFDGASMIITPFPGTDERIIKTLKAYFASVGFHETVVTTPEKHDEMIAFTSQLCHVIATTYARDPRVKEAIGFTAGSYANMTRIATQDAAVWRALYSENRDALVQVLDGFIDRFQALRGAIAADDAKQVEAMIEEGTRAKRQELLDRKRGDENV